ncbi:MAG: amidohydrolase [Campylobacter sp.]|nr:amidohydrolase [Campylobacter sp.]
MQSLNFDELNEDSLDEIAKTAIKFKDEMIKDRRLLHSHPESGWFTFFTTAFIARRLESLGYSLKMGKEAVSPKARYGFGSKEECQKALNRAKSLLAKDDMRFLTKMEDGLTGLVATIDTSRDGKTLGFRFDIDGVDVSESSEISHRPFKDGFSSDIKGITHACAHDGHTSIGLALAKFIAKNLDKFSGKFVFIFQTAEEGTRGAVGMEAASVLEGIDALFGAHIGVGVKPIGAIVCAVNKFMATTKFDLFLKGRSAHAAGAPQDGNNALLAASKIALDLHAISRHSGGETRVNVGVLNAGEGRNVIAPNAYLACEIRGDTTKLNEYMWQNAMNIVDGVCKIFGVESKVVKVGGTAGGDSSKEVGEIFYESAIKSPFIKNELIQKSRELSGCDDFSHFMYNLQQKGKIAGYALLGTNLKAGHHNSCFDFDENVMVVGLDLFIRVAFRLNKK